MPKNLNKIAKATDAELEVKVVIFRNKLYDQRREALLLLKSPDFEKAITAIYTRFGDVAISMPALTSMVVQELAGTQENYRLLADQAQTYIRNCEWLSITKGKNGGVRNRRAGHPVGKFGATCMSRIIHPPTHSRKRSKKS